MQILKWIWGVMKWSSCIIVIWLQRKGSHPLCKPVRSHGRANSALDFMKCWKVKRSFRTTLALLLGLTMCFSCHTGCGKQRNMFHLNMYLLAWTDSKINISYSIVYITKCIFRYFSVYFFRICIPSIVSWTYLTKLLILLIITGLIYQ